MVGKGVAIAVFLIAIVVVVDIASSSRNICLWKARKLSDLEYVEKVVNYMARDGWNRGDMGYNSGQDIIRKNPGCCQVVRRYPEEIRFGRISIPYKIVTVVRLDYRQLHRPSQESMITVLADSDPCGDVGNYRALSHDEESGPAFPPSAE